MERKKGLIPIKSRLIKFCFASVFCFLFISFSYSSSSRKNGTADIIIVEKPQFLSVYNRYKQNLTVEEKSTLTSFTPFIIIEREGTMEDGIRKYMSVKYFNNIYYILLDDTNEPANKSNLGSILYYSGVRILNDTLFIKKKDLKVKTPDSKGILEISGNIHVFRYFEVNDSCYASGMGENANYFWMSIRDIGPFSVLSDNTADRTEFTTFTAENIDLISRKLNEYNKYAKGILAGLNPDPKNHRKPPLWKIVDLSINHIKIQNENPGSTRYYKESFILLMNSIREEIKIPNVEIILSEHIAEIKSPYP